MLAFTYFDQNHTGYLLDKDVEEIIHTIGLQLSRAQVSYIYVKYHSIDNLTCHAFTVQVLINTFILGSMRLGYCLKKSGDVVLGYFLFACLSLNVLVFFDMIIVGVI